MKCNTGPPNLGNGGASTRVKIRETNETITLLFYLVVHWRGNGSRIDSTCAGRATIRTP